MGSNNDYLKLFKHPKWQKKRLEILVLANFECCDCGVKDVELHIHHSYYEYGLKPWEYPVDSLYCLCKDCHKEVTHVFKLFKRQLGKIDLSDIHTLHGYALALESANNLDLEIELLNTEQLCGFCSYWLCNSGGDLADFISENNYRITGNKIMKFLGL